MARKTTNPTVDKGAVDDTTAPIDNIVGADKSDVESNIENKNVKSRAVIEQLNDNDEIEVISLIPNVSYQDNRTGDFYEWENVGHSEFLTFDTLKNMWRNSKAYFKDLWLKPLDDRVINKFGLTKTFERYEFLMNEVNYTRKTINKICDEINSTPSGLKFSIFNKIKNMVAEGKITDIQVIMTLERTFNLDLTSILE